MPTADAATTGLKCHFFASRKSKRRRRALALLASYLGLGSLCGCSIFSSAAISTAQFAKNTAAPIANFVWNTTTPVADYVLNKTAPVTQVVHDKTLHYLGDSELEYYKGVATQIDYTHVGQEQDNRAATSEPPRSIRHPREDEIMDITLSEAIQRALSNSEVIRDRGQFLSPANAILNSPQQAPSVFDPAIQDTGILLGNRGVAAALSDFDANLTVNQLWGRNEQIQNNQFSSGGLEPGGTLTEDSATFQARLEKQMTTGGIFSLNHNVNYTLNNLNPNISNRLFGSFYTGNVQAQYRHPLLAGNGVEFNRIAGPLASNPLRVSGVNQGVVIARINNDISIADFEGSVRNLLKDVEDLYWELSLAYRAYDAEIVARNSNLRVWRQTKIKLEIKGDSDIAAHAQAEEAFFSSRSRAEDALARIYSTEAELRRLMGMTVNDGYILRPVDEPATAEFLPDWHISLAEALTNRLELRRQKWTIKSLELQVKAARTLTRPRLDFVSAYQVNMFGDTLLSQLDNDQRDTVQGLNSAYETLTQGDQTGWNLGFEMTMPIGFRTAHSQVRNLELQLTKARTMLSAQELEVSHELAQAFQELDRAYQTAQTNFNRRRSAELLVKPLQNLVELGIVTQNGENNVDRLLRAQVGLAQAEVDYYRSLVAYNQAITSIHFRKGSLLEFNNVALAESGWDPQAYVLALRRAWSRSHAMENEHLLHTEPAEFVTGPEEPHLMMPYEELQPLMNWDRMEPGMTNPDLAPGMIQAPEPNQPRASESPMPPMDPGTPRPYEEPTPNPMPMIPGSEEDLGWKKRGLEETNTGPAIPEAQADTQRPRRAELPLR